MMSPSCMQKLGTTSIYRDENEKKLQEKGLLLYVFIFWAKTESGYAIIRIWTNTEGETKK